MLLVEQLEILTLYDLLPLYDLASRTERGIFHDGKREAWMGPGRGCVPPRFDSAAKPQQFTTAINARE